MMLWSDEIERRAEAKVAAIPLRERLKWLLPKWEHVKPEATPWLIALLMPLLYVFTPEEGWRLAIVCILCFELAAVLIVVAWKRGQVETLEAQRDELHKLVRDQHDLLLADTVVKAMAPMGGTNPRMN